MSKEWGKGDPSFNKMFVTMFGSDEPATRRKIFKRVCIPFRLSLYLSLFYLCRYTPVMFIIILATGLAVISMAPSIKNPGEQWWSRRWHLGTSAVIFITACIGLFLRYRYNNNAAFIITMYIVPSLFIIDLFPGLHAALTR